MPKCRIDFAEGLLLTLIEEGPKALHEPENYEVRANLMWTATLALNGLLGAGVPQELGNPHAGAMNSPCCTGLTMPDSGRDIARHLQIRSAEKRREIAAIRGARLGLNSGAVRRAYRTGHRAHSVSSLNRWQVPTRLFRLWHQADAIPALVAQLQRHGLLALGEHRNLDRQALAASIRIGRLSA